MYWEQNSVREAREAVVDRPLQPSLTNPTGSLWCTRSGQRERRTHREPRPAAFGPVFDLDSMERAGRGRREHELGFPQERQGGRGVAV